MLTKISFGRTRHESSRIIFGGAAFTELPQQDADKTLDLILEQGINQLIRLQVILNPKSASDHGSNIIVKNFSGHQRRQTLL